MNSRASNELISTVSRPSLTHPSNGKFPEPRPSPPLETIPKAASVLPAPCNGREAVLGAASTPLLGPTRTLHSSPHHQISSASR
ncbi:hypothetical protein E2C01_032699 [Portunus trituberculatus]|uniref:Uncharacterized protein n=1 Tax=Portunus trituberculatus TaxID=210409 RepID=A0A5B7F3I3_PORTR|nr:hypothetical protein [Portunus trituberculatus]